MIRPNGIVYVKICGEYKVLIMPLMVRPNDIMHVKIGDSPKIPIIFM